MTIITLTPDCRRGGRGRQRDRRFRRVHGHDDRK
jgi:hypothetical protein